MLINFVALVLGFSGKIEILLSRKMEFCIIRKRTIKRKFVSISHLISIFNARLEFRLEINWESLSSPIIGN